MTAYQQRLEAEMAALFAAKTPFYVVDTETTGLIDDPNGQIIEIAVVNQDGKTIFHSLVKPDIVVPSAATKVHGITDGHLVNAPPLTLIWRATPGHPCAKLARVLL